MRISLAFITYNRLHYTKLALASVLADPGRACNDGGLGSGEYFDLSIGSSTRYVSCYTHIQAFTARRYEVYLLPSIHCNWNLDVYSSNQSFRQRIYLRSQKERSKTTMYNLGICTIWK